MPNPRNNKWSMESRGSRRQVGVATALMVILPNMVICYVVLFTPEGAYSHAAKVVIGALVCLMAAGGFLLLNRYPRNVTRLRETLKKIAEGELPASITLAETDNDVLDVEQFLNIVLEELRRKVDLLETQLRLTREMKAAMESQQQELLEAERQRVMITSLGAACHHIGQPATLLRTHLHFLKSRLTSPKDMEEIAECEKAVDAIAEVLDKLRRLSAFRTVPYGTFAVAGPADTENEILNID